jgi:uncharacterized BrkB/YihY/UPF0761 family membrane protein
MAEIWNIPGRQRPRFWARQVRGLLLVVVFAVGLAAASLLTWLGSYGGQAVAVALANLVAAAAVNVGLFLLVFRVLTRRQIPARELLAGGVVAGGLCCTKESRAWPGRRDSHLSWRPPAMAVLSEIDG